MLTNVNVSLAEHWVFVVEYGCRLPVLLLRCRIRSAFRALFALARPLLSLASPLQKLPARRPALSSVDVIAGLPRQYQDGSVGEWPVQPTVLGGGVWSKFRGHWRSQQQRPTRPAPRTLPTEAPAFARLWLEAARAAVPVQCHGSSIM